MLREQTKRESRQTATNGPPLPASPPESPKGGRFGGEGKIGRNADPGRREGGRRSRRSCPSLALGLFSGALPGLSKETAASCRCTSRENVQSPDSRFRGNDELHVFSSTGFCGTREWSVYHEDHRPQFQQTFRSDLPCFFSSTQAYANAKLRSTAHQRFKQTCFQTFF